MCKYLEKMSSVDILNSLTMPALSATEKRARLQVLADRGCFLPRAIVVRLNLVAEWADATAVVAYPAA